MKKLFSFAMALTICISGMLTIISNASTNDKPLSSYDGYIDTSKDFHYEKYSFDELLKMSDEDFITLDTYFGDIPKENLGMLSMYRCIYEILRGSGVIINEPYTGTFPHTEKVNWDIGTEKTIYLYNGDSKDDYNELLDEIKKLTNGSEFGGNTPLCALMPVDNHEGVVTDEAKYLAISSLRSTFMLADYNQTYMNFNRETFNSQMKEVFGDSIKYEISDYIHGSAKDLFVHFDVPECTEINQNNVLYFAKLYYGLTSISPYFGYSREYILKGNIDKSENIVTSTTTTASSTTPSTTTETTTTAENTISYGDVNSDRTIDAIDASMILTAYARSATGNKLDLSDVQKVSADVNKDGAIDAIDASLVLSYYAYKATGGTMSIVEFL